MPQKSDAFFHDTDREILPRFLATGTDPGSSKEISGVPQPLIDEYQKMIRGAKALRDEIVKLALAQAGLSAADRTFWEGFEEDE